MTAVVSVFDVVDYQGDRVRKGAFKNSIAKWMSSDRKLPVVWSHNWQDPYQHVGWVSSMRETVEGLEVDMVFDESDFAERVLTLIKEKRVNEYSFAYDVVRETKARDGATELIELDLIECGPCLRGANSVTYTVGVKSDTTATSNASAFSMAGRQELVHSVGASMLVHDDATENARTTDMILDNVWSKVRTRDASPSELEDIKKTLDRLEFGDMDARVRKAEAMCSSPRRRVRIAALRPTRSGVSTASRRRPPNRRTPRWCCGRT